MLVFTPILLIFLFFAAQEVSSRASDSVTLCDDDDGNCYDIDDDDNDDGDVEVQQPWPQNCESLQHELRKATETSRLVAVS